MRTVIDEYLYGVDKNKITAITNKLKINKYAVLEINLRYPYNYNLVIPQIK